jgi:hypothetical protein
LRLLQGRFSEGWHEYEWRLQEQNRKSRLYTHRSLPAQSWKDGNILLCAEQGAGDTFQFIRYALDVVRRGGNTFLECPKALHVLMKEMPQLSGVIAPGEEIPPHAYIVPLMSMPLLCGTNESTIPAPIPYLKAPEGRTLPSSLRDCDKRKVGFVWSGNAAHANDRNRSIPAQKLMKLAANPDIQAFSLQVGGSTECSDKIVDLAPFIRDYGDTAAFLDAMDLVISVDTSVAHLAGALGRPVWLLLPTCNDWRWMLNRDDSPWYPTMRIFRQTTLGDWDSVLSTVADALRIWSEGDKQNER